MIRPKPITISELTAQIKGTLEPAFTDVWISGEISNYRPAASGHAYFSLKDEDATISAAIFGWGKRKASFQLEDGLQVVCHGKVSVYAPRGNYQITIDQVEPLGLGALQLAFEQLKKKLAAEGLFSPEHKVRIPDFPNKVVIITSPSGAAIQDILNVLGRRAPQIEVLVIPALVQGDDAPRVLIRAIQAANRHKLGDVILLTRGGGSIEDLWCFNDEGLARAIFESELPIVSAVGHEIDFTISDFVADLRAPTPSAAAEIISASWVSIRDHLRELYRRLQFSIDRTLAEEKLKLAHLSARLVNPRDRLREQSQRVDDLHLRLERGIQLFLERRRARLEQLAGRLDVLSPLKVLERGYSVVRESKGTKVIRSAHEIRKGQNLVIVLHDGEAKVQAIEVSTH